MSDLQPIQQERLREIGARLKEAREQKQLSLDDVSVKTLIRATILRAIEEGDAQPLPEPVYIKGFILRFGNLVGLSGKELSESFPWQPSPSVPAGFVSAGLSSGNLASPPPSRSVAVSKNSAQTEAPPKPLNGLPLPSVVPPDPVLEPMDPPPVDPPINSGVTESGAIALQLSQPEPIEPEPIEPEPIEPEPAVVESVPDRGRGSTLPDLDAAYDSRAAVFDEILEAPLPVEPLPVEPLPVEPLPVEPANSTPAAPIAEEAISLAAVPPEVAALDGGEAQTSLSSDSLSSDSLPSDSLPSDSLPLASPWDDAPAPNAPESPPPAPEIVPRELPLASAPLSYREPENRRRLPWPLVLLGGLLGIGVAVWAVNSRNANAPASLETPPEAAPAAVEPPPVAPAPQVPPTPEGKVVLDLEVRGAETWLTVAVDGVDQIDDLQTAGFRQRWEGGEQIQLWTPRPDLVWISVNGGTQQPFGTMAEISQATPIKTASFKPDGSE